MGDRGGNEGKLYEDKKNLGLGWRSTGGNTGFFLWEGNEKFLKGGGGGGGGGGRLCALDALGLLLCSVVVVVGSTQFA